MWTCPVCDGKSEKYICNCGFDRSKYYENFPTLMPMGAKPAISRLRQERVRKNRNGYRCTHCGCDRFYISNADYTVHCVDCDQVPPVVGKTQLKPTKIQIQPFQHRITAGAFHTAVLCKD